MAIQTVLRVADPASGGDPVIFTGGAGGGAGEYEFPNAPSAPTNAQIPVAVPAGSRVMAAWYVPFDNIPALTLFAQISIAPTATGVQITAHGVPGSVTRIRIAIYVAIGN